MGGPPQQSERPNFMKRPKRPALKRGIATWRKALAEILRTGASLKVVRLVQGNIMQEANEDLRKAVQANLDLAAGLCRLGFHVR